jgi:hypothetical protein
MNFFTRLRSLFKKKTIIEQASELFSEKDKSRLIEAYRNGQFNQFGHVVVSYVIQYRVFKLPKEKLIPFYIAAAGDVLPKIQDRLIEGNIEITDSRIIQGATYLYDILIQIEPLEVDNTF